jgi:hypothetical protein
MRYEFLNRKAISRDVYQEVLKIITDCLFKATDSKASLLLYGSLCDDRLKPGISDIDLILFFWDEFVLDPAMMCRVSDSLMEQLHKIRFDTGWYLDVSILDLGNAKDGRFIPYNDNFSKVFFPHTGDSELIFGKPFVGVLNPVSLLDPVESRIAYNLQSLRAYVLFGRCNERWNQGGSAGRELKVFQQVRSLSRKVVDLVNPDQMQILKDKNKCVIELQKAFPNIDISILAAIETMFRDKDLVIDTILGCKAFPLLVKALTCYETILKEAVQRLPMRSMRK